MTAVFRYISYDGTSFNVDLGATSVRLGSGFSFTELAEMGAVGQGSIELDDTTATAGHSSDAILGLQQFSATENAASTNPLFRGWTGSRTYSRGPADPTNSLRTGVQRKIGIALEDGNVLGGRWIFDFKADDSAVNRPQETASARITWLLSTAYFSGVVDSGLVHPAAVTLDANDYSTQTPADLLNDCCTANGDNWFVYWDRTAQAWSLAVFNFTTYNAYPATLKLSNDRTLIDSSITGGAGLTDCWPVEPDAVMTRDPSNITTRVLLPYAKGSLMVAGTSTTYPHVDHSAPSTSVKTSTAATAKANRYLADNATETDRITCRAKIAAANVNDALPGQLIIASFIEFPTYSAASYFRIPRRTVSQQEASDQFYTVEYELIPVAPTSPVSTSAALDRAFLSEALSEAVGTHLLQFSGTGDTPPSGYAPQPKTGLVTYDTTGLIAPGVATGLKMGGAGTDIHLTMTVHAQFAYTLGSPGGSTFQIIAKNGASTIASSSVATDPGSGLHGWDPVVSFDTSGITVAANDVIETYAIIGAPAANIGTVPIAGSFAPPFQLVMTGTLA